MTACARHRRFLPLLALLLAACGGIEGTGSPQGSVEEPGLIEGAVNGLGSVVVNGIHYETEGAEILINGLQGSAADLQVGMLLRLVAEPAVAGQSRQARRIEFDALLQGPVESLQEDGRQLIVLGQLLQLDEDSVLSGDAAAAPAAGSRCSVSGYRGVGGTIQVSRLDCATGYTPGVTPVEVEGVIQALTAEGFRIGSLAVDLRELQQLELDGETLRPGLPVEVRGVQAGSGQPLRASHVRLRPAPRYAAGQTLVREGLITRYAGLADFELDGLRVNAAQAQREDASPRSPAADLRILVRGVVDAAGVLQAQSYVLREPGSLRYRGRVDEVDAAGGRLTLFGLPLQAQALTQFRDLGEAAQRDFSLADLRPGDYLELRAFRGADGQPRLTRVERPRAGAQTAGGPVQAASAVLPAELLASSGRDAVRGPVDGFDAVSGLVQIGGVQVRSHPLFTRYRGRDGQLTAAAVFFAGLQPGDRLEAGGSEVDDGIEADEIGYAP